MHTRHCYAHAVPPQHVPSLNLPLGRGHLLLELLRGVPHLCKEFLSLIRPTPFSFTPHQPLHVLQLALAFFRVADLLDCVHHAHFRACARNGGGWRPSPTLRHHHHLLFQLGHGLLHEPELLVRVGFKTTTIGAHLLQRFGLDLELVLQGGMVHDRYTRQVVHGTLVGGVAARCACTAQVCAAQASIRLPPQHSLEHVPTRFGGCAAFFP